MKALLALICAPAFVALVVLGASDEGLIPVLAASNVLLICVIPASFAEDRNTRRAGVALASTVLWAMAAVAVERALS